MCISSIHESRELNAQTRNCYYDFDFTSYVLKNEKQTNK